MRKNQNGVSMISLVITIIVMIILAAVAFGSSMEVISNASFADFKNDINEVQQFVEIKVNSEFGFLKAEGSGLNEQQVRNWLAKGASELSEASGDDAWLPLSISSKLAATQINPDTCRAVFENDLPEMTVNTANGTKIPVSYFLTKSGKVFIWPPFFNEEDGRYYVTEDDVVLSGDKPLSGDADLIDLFSSTSYKVVVGDDVVYINNQAAAYSGDLTTTNAAGIPELAVVSYLDKPGATAPVGIEDTKIYSAAVNKLVNR